MPEVRITQKDIDSLGRKLDQLAPELTEREQALLAFVFSVAADVIQRSRSGPVLSAAAKQDQPVVVTSETTASSVHEQFASAFTPARSMAKPVLGRIGPGSIGPAPTPQD
ncbi:hypothetical protein [Actinophytocola xanthii]|uniref:Uncharacterized protein n=1 Tax=Actinophytocola xanthii TaxID=1912961 RepID=A0A1Q8CK71_9PSEU|nr:hypothetical protein [Actinophytocola xanthii]OLF14752.1 hypothetical protein BU204_25420 [Actinophytocola xanthii]